MSDFQNIIEVSGGTFAYTVESAAVDFLPSGDDANIVIPGSAYGEGAYGEGSYGGSTTVTVSSPTTQWTNIDEP